MGDSFTVTATTHASDAFDNLASFFYLGERIYVMATVDTRLLLDTLSVSGVHVTHVLSGNSSGLPFEIETVSARRIGISLFTAAEAFPMLSQGEVATFRISLTLNLVLNVNNK